MKKLVPALCALLAAAVPVPVLAAEPATAALRFLHDFNRKNVLAAVEKMPEADFAYRPTPEVRSFGEIAAHVADVHYLLCSAGKGEAVPVPTGDQSLEKTRKTKAEILAVLRESFDYCEAVFAAMTDARLGETIKDHPVQGTRADALSIAVYHAGQHYGNMVTYMRLKGLVPPSSEKRAAPPAQ